MAFSVWYIGGRGHDVSMSNYCWWSPWSLGSSSVCWVSSLETYSFSPYWKKYFKTLQIFWFSSNFWPFIFYHVSADLAYNIYYGSSNGGFLFPLSVVFFTWRAEKPVCSYCSFYIWAFGKWSVKSILDYIGNWHLFVSSHSKDFDDTLLQLSIFFLKKNLGHSYTIHFLVNAVMSSRSDQPVWSYWGKDVHHFLSVVIT